MTQASTSRRGIVYRVLSLLSVVLILAAFFQPTWSVSLKAPNYPEATFPQGIRILFHLDTVSNGCEIRESSEVQEYEALDCVHEMDTINHYVGMYPIASGGPVEKAFSPYLFAMIGVMILAFAAPGRMPRMVVSVVGYGAVAVWMSLAMHGPDGIKYHTSAYLEGLLVSLGQDSSDSLSSSNLPPIVQMLKESLEESEAKEMAAAAEEGDKTALVATLKAVFENDMRKKPPHKREEWTGSVMQVFKWHYAKSLGRWFNEPERNDPLVATMDAVATILYVVVLALMGLLIFAAWSVRSIFYWLLVVIPLAVPVGFLAEYAGWLWWYGHSLNEMGAFTLKPFMPTVFGDGKVAQFTTHSYPTIGFGLLVGSSVLLLFAGLIRFKQVRLAGDAANRM